jgi:hypothetical protein
MQSFEISGLHPNDYIDDLIKKQLVMDVSKTNNRYAITIIGILFFIFGFITWLNGTLIPFLKLALQLETDIQAFFVTFAFYMAYFFFALPSAYIIKKQGFKKEWYWPTGHCYSFFDFYTGSFVKEFCSLSYRSLCTGNSACFVTDRFQPLHECDRTNGKCSQAYQQNGNLQQGGWCVEPFNFKLHRFKVCMTLKAGMQLQLILR